MMKLQPDLATDATWTVDEASGEDGPRAGRADGAELKLAAFAVTVLGAP